ncbi:predicted protein [Chaetomium globosum CBS 148.51]|uniref:Uncharacterized protein n=1 Tax=Chaetomium globosum (strain ATCC 6205 / CBS 148.51 / DSM 1962 / NBRC 6347 / NRRL 1970) TaxID=306901 RepID=Q2GV22_CHAGB|nr:uncharacterized protein CHGG_08182 [Chaetomium globosum CBS 148.51]EAQ86929.1 predicted protein [Chaetomium globosum CBS 148.51]
MRPCNIDKQISKQQAEPWSRKAARRSLDVHELGIEAVRLRASQTLAGNNPPHRYSAVISKARLAGAILHAQEHRDLPTPVSNPISTPQPGEQSTEWCFSPRSATMVYAPYNASAVDRWKGRTHPVLLRSRIAGKSWWR